MTDLHWLDAGALAQGYAAAEFTPVEVLAACRAQADRLEPLLNALVPSDPQPAEAQAEASAARWRAGKPLSPLDGVPVLVKDLLLTRGEPTLRGSWTVDAAGPWAEDAPAVARLREAGAVLMARTTTPEIGWKGVTDSPRHGITRNPWDRTKTPGGSSGGASAAVAAGYAPLALGTDGGGSIRIPASFTGIFGLKPSFGRVPAYPLSPFGTVAHVGPMTRTVADAARLLDIIARPDPRDWHALPPPDQRFAEALDGGLRGLRVAWSPDLGFAEVDPEVAALTADAVRRMADLGADVVRVDPGFEDPRAIFRILWWAGARAALGHLPPEQRHRLDPGLARALDQAAAITLDDYLAATRARGALGSQMRQFMADHDLLVTPAMPIPAFEAGRLSPGADDPHWAWLGWTPFSYPFNLTQQPAASLPCGFTAAGLPVGLQLVGRMFDDATVLRAAAALETELALTGRHPPLSIP
jgi:aspartyl-tRNA(Asn)/glutamyl-tRNA(Gln) amidotransferase subunit A